MEKNLKSEAKLADESKVNQRKHKCFRECVEAVA
jgi:hypothetical protein